MIPREWRQLRLSLHVWLVAVVATLASSATSTVEASAFSRGLKKTTHNSTTTPSYVTVPYGIPNFAMKMIILDGDDFVVRDFQTALETIVRTHLEQSLTEQLPAALAVTDTATTTSEPMSQENFIELSVTTILEHTPLNLNETEGVPIAVVRAAFEGVTKFNVSHNVAAAADLLVTDTDDKDIVFNSTQLPQYVGTALDQHFGFWNLAAAIANDTILARTGKLQIAIEGIVVAEGSLIGDEAAAPEGPAVDNAAPSRFLSVKAMVCIGAALALVAALVLLVMLYINQRRIEAEIERKKLERREQARKARRKRVENMDPNGSSSSNNNSSSHNLGSSSSSSNNLDEEAGTWMDNKARQVSTVPDRLVAKNAMPKSNPKQPRLRSRPALEAKKSSDAALLHCIAEEEESSCDEEDDDSNDVSSSRFLDAHDELDDIEGVYGLLSKSDYDDDNDNRNGSHGHSSAAAAVPPSRLWRDGRAGASSTTAALASDSMNAPFLQSHNMSIAQQPSLYKSHSNAIMSPLQQPKKPCLKKQKQQQQECLDILGMLESQTTKGRGTGSGTNRWANDNPYDYSSRHNSDRVIT